MRDERYFTDPEAFVPERHLQGVDHAKEENEEALSSFKPEDPSSIVFGFGRRCVPFHLKKRAMHLTTLGPVLCEL